MEKGKSTKKMRKWREKLKENDNKWKEYLKRDAARKRKQRNKEKKRLEKNKKEILLKRAKIKEQQRKYREKLKIRKNEKNKNNENHETAYRCPQTLGKALRKVENALPSDEKRKKVVLLKLVQKYLKNEIISKKDKNNISICETSNIAEIVKKFYLRDDISRQLPGRKDVKYIKTGQGVKELITKRHMILSIREAYEIFKEEHENYKIGKSKFYEFRPKNVMLSSKTPHNTCLCKYHTNFELLLSSASKILKKFPNNSKKFLMEICCDVKNENCMMNLCNNCENDISFAFMPLTFDKNISTSWKEWKEVDGRMTLTIEEGTFENVMNELEKKLPQFKMHCYTRWVQQNYFRQKKENISSDELVIQIDFAENYALTCQNEIQSAHWNRRQITIFTCAAWVKSKSFCFAIISDELHHNKFTSIIFLEKIIRFLEQEYYFTSLSIHSDGFAGQFKNKYMITNICHMLGDFNLRSVEWSFFATSHGKGAVDGIGAVLKRKIWEEIKNQGRLVQNANDFFSCATEKVKGVKVFLVSKLEIEEDSTKYSTRWQNVKCFKGVQKFHFFKAMHSNKIVYGVTSSSSLNSFEIF